RRDSLQVEVQAQVEVVARFRRLALQERMRKLTGIRSHLASTSIGDDLPVTRLAVQFPFIEKFDTRLSGMGRACVGGRIETLEVDRAQRADIADDMGREFAVRIVANQARLEIHARKPGPL